MENCQARTNYSIILDLDKIITIRWNTQGMVVHTFNLSPREEEAVGFL